MTTMFLDAQRALSFLISQVSVINTKAYQVQYPEIRYHTLVPVDTSMPEWAPSVTYFSMDGVGQAQWINGNAMDIPRAETLRTKFETGVKLAGIGYGYTLEELGQAEILGIPLTAQKATVARRVSEEFIDKVALFGDATANYQGLCNNSAVTAGTVAANGTGSSPLWVNKTQAQIMADVNGVIGGIYTGSNAVEWADTLLLPITQYINFSSAQYGVSGNLTLLEWLKQYNAFTAETGQQLTIRGVYGLETAGSGSTGRLVAYRNDPNVLKLNMPMPYRFLQPYPIGAMQFEVPGIFRLGGVDVMRPSAVRYADGFM